MIFLEASNTFCVTVLKDIVFEIKLTKTGFTFPILYLIVWNWKNAIIILQSDISIFQIFSISINAMSYIKKRKNSYLKIKPT